MTRALLPGRWNRDGRAVPSSVPHPHLERVTLTELDLELPHDADRVIAAPQPKPLRLTRKGRDRARDLMRATAALALLAFGLWIWPR